MIIYVESNFVLELALLQDEHRHCREIIGLCGRNTTRLVIPMFSIAEPIETMVRRHKQRKELSRTLTTEIGQLVRTESYEEKASVIQEITSLMVRSVAEEQSRLDEVLRQLLGCADTIALNMAILDAAGRYRADHHLSLQDSIVYASILHHMETQSPPSSCFLTKDPAHFGVPEIAAALEAHNCKLLFKFATGLEYIRSQTERGSGA